MMQHLFNKQYSKLYTERVSNYLPAEQRKPHSAWLRHLFDKLMYTASLIVLHFNNVHCLLSKRWSPDRVCQTRFFSFFFSIFLWSRRFYLKTNGRKKKDSNRPGISISFLDLPFLYSWTLTLKRQLVSHYFTFLLGIILIKTEFFGINNKWNFLF